MIKGSEIVTIDYETLPIDRRPDFPPIPVGVAIKDGGKKSRYLAWGHPAGNNCSWEDARRALAEHYESGRPLLFHNAWRFDVEVGEAHMQLPRPRWDQVHDTLYMLFLRDPHAKSLDLKSSAENILGVKPEERDAVVDWLIDRQPIPGMKLNDKRGKYFAGAFTAHAPGDVVGRYACGDVDRTFALAVEVGAEIARRGMREPYDRERRLAPYLMQMEQDGIRVDLDRLESDIGKYKIQVAQIDRWLEKKLRSSTLNVDSGAELAEALVRSGCAREEDFGYTTTGKMQTNKDALKRAIKDPVLHAALAYRSRITKCLSTWMAPWAETANRSGGFIYTGWNSVRSTDDGDRKGTRTGRLSSKPMNLQNIPTSFDPLFVCKERPDLPRFPLDNKPMPLPLVRSYVIPNEPGHVLVGRDYSQQELRAMGHFEGGVLCEAYNENPWLDVHTFATLLINEMLGASFGRKEIKGTGFGLIYGMGLGLLAERIGTTVEIAKQVKEAYLKTFPGLRVMYQEMKRRAAANEPIRTWGGREYYCEPPVFNGTRRQTFDYKMVNVLIQGSSGDCTKEAMVRYHDAKPAHHKCILTVHDELCSSVPADEIMEGMEAMRSAMESVKFRVPMLTDGKWSDTNWAEMKPYDKEGKVLYAA